MDVFILFLKDLSSAAWLGTSFSTPSEDSSEEWFVAKTKGIAVGAAASLLTGGITSAVKNWSDRTRPDGSNTDSFPSGHSSSASAYATLAARNMRSIDMDANLRKTMEIGFGVIAAGTAWARVEGDVHYPSAAVLAGSSKRPSLCENYFDIIRSNTRWRIEYSIYHLTCRTNEYNQFGSWPLTVSQ